ncbi:hypothetical protein Taro_006562 [Colocasia esculenta]|uniref:Uncharacterized protein n=1 Tax=Colocasia esculenta TaxID=4460 RepID=A0A843TT47_COLES|nr:hypothetical protein [Colocasia esculenta]
MVMSNDDLPHELRETQCCFDVMMMVLFNGGRERSELEWQKLFRQFSGYKILISRLSWWAIIELYHCRRDLTPTRSKLSISGVHVTPSHKR